MQIDYDNDLLSYFTDMEYLRSMFKEYVSAEKLPKRLIVLHGVGGVGKSSLLRMFRLHCKREKIPVALVSGGDALDGRFEGRWNQVHGAQQNVRVVSSGSGEGGIRSEKDERADSQQSSGNGCLNTCFNDSWYWTDCWPN
jgi:hypothetical protein